MGHKTEEDKTKASRGFKRSFVFLLLNISFAVPVGGFSFRSCRISGNVAKCVEKQLTAVPRDIPSTVSGFDLAKNKIRRLQAEDFNNLPDLAFLNLSRNSITQMSGGTFAGLNSLEELNLNFNKLNALEEDVFQGLVNLTRLTLHNNRIAEVASTAFRSTTRLTLLDISHNWLHSLQHLHLVLQHLPNLRQLVVSFNNLTAFRSDQLTNSSLQLRDLDLFENPIRVFSIAADVFPELNSLRLGGYSGKPPMRLDVRNETFLSRVSALDIGGLSLANGKALLRIANSSLTSLCMGAMQRAVGELINVSCTIPTMSKLQLQKHNLSEVSSGMFRRCVHVTELDLTDNAIGEISDDAFRCLKALKILNLSRNKLSLVPAATRDLPSLEKLDFSECNINKLRCDDFANHTRLRELNLYKNSISLLSKCLFKDLQGLQTLKLQTNLITKIGNTFTARMPSLTTLHLNENKIVGIEPGELRGLVSLQRLSLHTNKIQKLRKGSFMGLTNLTQLLLQKNKIRQEDLQTGAFNDLINLERLDLTENMIMYRNSSALSKPPFSNLSRLEVLSLRGQGHRGWRFLPRNLLQGLSSLLFFGTRNIRLLNLPSDMFVFTPRLEKLDLQSNSLPDLTPELFSPLGNLQSLYISKTNLRSLDFLSSANLTKLQFLQARQNQFSVIQEDVIKSLPALSYIDLFGNGFSCECHNKWFIDWVQNNSQTQVSDAYNFKCNYPPSVKDKKLMDIDMQPCSLDIGFACFVATTCLVLFSTLAPFVYHFVRQRLVYAYYIFLAWLADTKHKNRAAAHQYDAFVSYNAHDEPWVVGQLLPRLEGQQGWRLCLHHRDFQPGKPIISNITDAIYGSRKTICVISHRYLQSEWCSREIQAASFRLFDENKDVLILVFLEEIPGARLSPYHRMRKLLKRQTYLSWPRAAEHRPLFWEKLRQALQSGQELDRERRLRLTVAD